MGRSERAKSVVKKEVKNQLLKDFEEALKIHIEKPWYAEPHRTVMSAVTKKSLIEDNPNER